MQTIIDDAHEGVSQKHKIFFLKFIIHCCVDSWSLGQHKLMSKSVIIHCLEEECIGKYAPSGNLHPEARERSPRRAFYKFNTLLPYLKKCIFPNYVSLASNWTPLPPNNNGKFAQKSDLILTFEWGVVFAYDQCV